MKPKKGISFVIYLFRVFIVMQKQKKPMIKLVGNHGKRKYKKRSNRNFNRRR